MNPEWKTAHSTITHAKPGTANQSITITQTPILFTFVRNMQLFISTFFFFFKEMQVYSTPFFFKISCSSCWISLSILAPLEGSWPCSAACGTVNHMHIFMITREMKNIPASSDPACSAPPRDQSPCCGDGWGRLCAPARSVCWRWTVRPLGVR